jgi:Lon protease-like protein
MIKDVTFDTLPTTLPIFPLAGAMLLPRGELPLNIFEPRYLAMVDYVMGTPTRLMGMVQPKGDGFFGVGCAGRINSFHETNDGRYLITLAGLVRFGVGTELPQQNGFRIMQPAYTLYEHDFGPPPPAVLDRGRLMGLLKEYFKAEGLSCNWDQVKSASDDTLITALSMVCPFDVAEKQALLEAVDSAARGAMFLTMLEMAVLAGKQANDDDEPPQYH